MKKYNLMKDKSFLKKLIIVSNNFDRFKKFDY